ncbi:MAG: NAD(P)H-hydrate epimerase, partial [Pararhodobacter sp.]|nr:NAD(P)H-hydrate epimerase [Pararhodobacter sp.]
MTDLVTSAQMRAIERAAIESGSVTGRELMDRAGAGVVGAVIDHWPGLAAGGHAVVLCGPGNNGGDGFVIARLLHERGWLVSLFLFGDPARLPEDARANHDRWTRLGAVHPLEDPQGGVYGGFGDRAPDLIVDALFGTGLTRDLPGEVEQALTDITSWMQRRRRWVPVVAVDIPSGLCADSGARRGCELAAGLTVTFHCAKPGHYLGEGPERCG